MAKQKHPIQIFLGVKYYMKPSGYYKSEFRRHGGRYMHRVVWEHTNGPIDDGFHVHHINGDKGDNRIENLEVMQKGAHKSHHMHEQHETEEGLAKTMRALALARDAARAWHKSDVGRAWHSTTSKQAWVGREKTEQRCSKCDSAYFGFVEMAKRSFCSPACQSAARRDSGVDDECRNCTECGASFACNKYKKTKTCGKECWKKALRKSRKSLAYT